MSVVACASAFLSGTVLKFGVTQTVGIDNRFRLRGSTTVIIAGIRIDRSRHLETAFRRQQEEECRRAEASVTCPLDCVREVRSLAELEQELEEAEAVQEVVVVDFYNSACGACKDILPHLASFCKNGCGAECEVNGHQGAVRFLKHNVRDEYDDKTDIATFYKIRMVPMFAFFMDGGRVEQFATRNVERVTREIGILLTRYHKENVLDNRL